MSYLALSDSFVMGLRPLYIFLFLQCGDRLSDAYSRQILTTKVYPRAVRVTHILKSLSLFSVHFSLNTKTGTNVNLLIFFLFLVRD